MVFGTGVMRALYACFFVRGLTVGIAAASSLFISQRTGVSQTVLVACRGVGLVLGPTAFGRIIGRMVWSGESQSGVTLALTTKAICGLLMPRAKSYIILYIGFFVMGLTMAAMDTICNYLVAKCYGKKTGGKLIVYDAVYMSGCMLAPFVAVATLDRAWDLLAGLDLLLALSIGGKRACVGKPRDWKRKIRGPVANGSCAADNGSSPRAPPQPLAQSEPRPSRAVLSTGVAYIFVAQVVQASISCWGFTFAATVLRLPHKLAAMLPSAFAFGAISTRIFVVLPASTRVLPSSLCHAGCCLTLICSTILCLLVRMHTGMVGPELEEDEATVMPTWLLYCFLVVMACMGAGLCANNSMMLGAMQLHGTLSSQEVGWYNTSFCLGTTLGMSLPGMVGLPRVEILGSLCLFLVINSRRADFPRTGALPKEELAAVAAEEAPNGKAS